MNVVFFFAISLLYEILLYLQLIIKSRIYQLFITCVHFLIILIKTHILIGLFTFFFKNPLIIIFSLRQCLNDPLSLPLRIFSSLSLLLRFPLSLSWREPNPVEWEWVQGRTFGSKVTVMVRTMNFVSGSHMGRRLAGLTAPIKPLQVEKGGGECSHYPTHLSHNHSSGKK